MEKSNLMTPPKKIRFPKFIKDVPYEIEWTDTFGFTGWFTEEQIDEKTAQCSVALFVGYFIRETEDFIILAMGKETQSKDFAPYSSPKWIPKGFIKSIRKL